MTEESKTDLARSLLVSYSRFAKGGLRDSEANLIAAEVGLSGFTASDDSLAHAHNKQRYICLEKATIYYRMKR